MRKTETSVFTKKDLSQLCRIAARTLRTAVDGDLPEAASLNSREEKLNNELLMDISPSDRKRVEGELARVNAAIANLKAQWHTMSELRDRVLRIAQLFSGTKRAPDILQGRLNGLRSRFELINSGSGLPDSAAVTEALEALCLLAHDWMTAEAIVAAAETHAKSVRERAANLPYEDRIYLIGNSRQLKQAVRVHKAPVDERGRPYISAEMYKPELEPMLPIIYQRRKVSIDFSTHPRNAAGANIHGIFTPESWDKVSGAVIDRANGCEYCGRRGTYGVTSIVPYPPSNKRLDAHEMMKFRLDGGDHRIGVVTLESIRSLCPFCHYQHHVDKAAYDARQRGESPEVLLALLQARNMGINGQGIEEYEQERAAGIARNREFEGSVDHVILDLTILAHDPNHKDFVFTLRADADPTWVDRVAGVSVRDHAGVVHEARTVDDLIEKMQNEMLQQRIR